ncbi:MAG: hypothetical protein ACRC41_08255 [Sarcina sp.]
MMEKDWRLGFIGFLGFFGIPKFLYFLSEGGSPFVLLNLLPFLFFIYFLPSRNSKK